MGCPELPSYFAPKLPRSYRSVMTGAVGPWFYPGGGWVFPHWHRNVGPAGRCSTLPSYRGGQVSFPHWRRKVTTPVVGPGDDSGAGDLAHGLVEGQAEHAHEQVNGVAGEITLGPAPIAVFNDQAGVGGQDKIACRPFQQLESAFLEQWRQRRQTGGADLLAGPASWRGGIRGWGCHSLSSNGAG